MWYVHAYYGPLQKSPPTPARVTPKAVAAQYFPNGIDFSNSVHVHLLSRLGITIDSRDPKAIVVTYHPFTVSRVVVGLPLYNCVECPTTCLPGSCVHVCVCVCVCVYESACACVFVCGWVGGCE